MVQCLGLRIFITRGLSSIRSLGTKIPQASWPKKKKERKKQFSTNLHHVYSVHAQSRVTLCNTMDCVSPGFSVHGIFQARILEWIAISYSREPSQPRIQTHISCISQIGRQILYHCITWETLKMYADPNANTEGFYGKKIACNPGICLTIPLNICLMKQNLQD